MTKSQISLIIKLITPEVSVVAGALTTWLLVHIHVLGTFGFSQNQIAQAIVVAIIFIITTTLTYLAAHTQLFQKLDEWAADIKPLPLTPNSGILEVSSGTVAQPSAVTINNYHGTGHEPTAIH